MLNIAEAELIKVAMFGFAAILGMASAYTMKWSQEAYKTTGWFRYMCNPPEIGKALVTLFTMCMAAGGLDYLESLRGIHILIAGAGIGYLVPKNSN
jgi:hypothetical protein